MKFNRTSQSIHLARFSSPPLSIALRSWLGSRFIGPCSGSWRYLPPAWLLFWPCWHGVSDSGAMFPACRCRPAMMRSPARLRAQPPVGVGVSIGIGIAPIRGKAANPKALIEAAGAACYVAKKMGKNSVFVSEAWPQDDPIRNLTNRVDLAALASFAAGRAVPPLFPIRPYTPLHTGKMQRVILKTRTHALLWRHR